MGNLAIRSFETIRLTKGSDQLHAESMMPHVFSSEEAATFLGRVYDHWLASGEPTDTSFLLPSKAQFRPRRIATDEEQRMILPVDLDDDGLPATGRINEEAVIGVQNPFRGFTLTSLNDCRLRREPIYFQVSIQLEEVGLDFARLLLPSVDDQDRVSRVDVVHRFIGERQPRPAGESAE